MNWKFLYGKAVVAYLCCYNFPGRSEENHNLSKLHHKRFAPEQISAEIDE